MAEASSIASSHRPLHWTWLGRRPYAATFELQEAIRLQVKAAEGPERLLLLEHDPVFTLGRNARGKDVVADRGWLHRHGVEVHESNRGGQVTYHGPGQLVGYPIVDLNPDRRDIGHYVRDLQEVLIRSLADHGIEARRRDGKEHIGVWVGDGKIASIGVHLSRWVTLHGFALNVAPDLEHFSGIVACGLPDVTMTSIERQGVAVPELPDLAATVARRFAEVFDRRDLVAAPPSTVDQVAVPEVC
ncbi:MAG: lipoyl(octanoyl) transferase LipB [Acidobacteriota bacterium]